MLVEVLLLPDLLPVLAALPVMKVGLLAAVLAAVVIAAAVLAAVGCVAVAPVEVEWREPLLHFSASSCSPAFVASFFLSQPLSLLGV